VPSLAPRISPRLLAELARIDEKAVPIAEVNRRLGAAAERLELPRPSYQRVRVLVHELRRVRREPRTRDVLIEVALRARPFEALLDHAAGTLPK